MGPGNALNCSSAGFCEEGIIRCQTNAVFFDENFSDRFNIGEHLLETAGVVDSSCFWLRSKFSLAMRPFVAFPLAPYR